MAFTSTHYDGTGRNPKRGVPRTEQKEKKGDKIQKDNICSINQQTIDYTKRKQRMKDLPPGTIYMGGQWEDGS